MRRAPRTAAWIAATVAILIGVFPTSARAFCRTTTVPVPPDFASSGGQCFTQGVPVFWRGACVGYSLQRAASAQVALQDASALVSRAFKRWTGISCPAASPPDGAPSSRTSIDAYELAPVDCDRVEYDKDGPNQNVIVFRDDAWPHGDTVSTLALTTLSFDPETGEILDADMELNTHDQRVTLVDPLPADGYDLESILTHEVGHFLGLAHSDDATATMSASYTPGSSRQRELGSDDVEGLCSIYRADGSRPVLDGKVILATACDPTPRRGLSQACAGQADDAAADAGACATAPPRSSSVPATLVISLGATIAFVRRRARRRRAGT